MGRNVDETIDISYKLLGVLWVIALICLCVSFAVDEHAADCQLATYHIDKC
ncbi:hypothetical protein [Kordiimonas lipolytica]|uniref:hypothetical protein n=1 Tax=Kordiimonas lipolytica TaxID=1662421 RepID=UPI000AD9D23B|nr:hypothetical protein [Kordiimonas lipolytica]